MFNIKYNVKYRIQFVQESLKSKNTVENIKPILNFTFP